MLEEQREDKKYIAYIVILAIVIAIILVAIYYKKDRKAKTFITAVCNDDITKVKSLLKKEPYLVNTQAQDKYYKTKPLFSAPSKEMAELLIQYGADINARCHTGSMPIHQFVYSSSKDALELLISKGADVNAKDNSGETPLHYASNTGNIEVATILLSHGANINAKNNKGYTPLRNAMEGKLNPTEQKLFADFLRSHGAKE